MIAIRLPRNAAGGYKVVGLHKAAQPVENGALAHWLNAVYWKTWGTSWSSITAARTSIPLSSLMSEEERVVIREKTKSEKRKRQQAARSEKRRQHRREQSKDFDRIVRLALHEGPMKTVDIARELAVTRQRVLAALYRLEDQNSVRYAYRQQRSCKGLIPRGHWSLP